MRATVLHGVDSFDVIDYLAARDNGVPSGEHVATPRVIAQWEETSVSMELMNPGSSVDLVYTKCASTGATCGNQTECQRRFMLMRRSIYEAYGGPAWEPKRTLNSKFTFPLP